MTNSLPWAITLGDPAGIGPEIIAKAFLHAARTANCFVAGDLATMQRAVQWLDAQAPTGLSLQSIEDPTQALGHAPHVIPVLQATPAAPLVEPGRVSAQAGRVAADCVMWAARAALQGHVAGLITAPLHKQALAEAGVPFPGHTELLQALAAQHAGVAAQDMPVRMMLANDALRTVLVSIHVSLRDAIEAVTFGNVLQTLQITHASLSRSLGRAPRMALAGLNPHAGEGGLMGREELDILIPVVQHAQTLGLQVSGPHAPDTVFMRARAQPGQAREFDVVVAMYHDQGLIPVKYLGLDGGVNVTLGLPLIRTSPDHGTAFDLVGRGAASAHSLLAAIAQAQGLS